MKKTQFLYLSQDDVVEVGMNLRETLSIVENVLKEHTLRYFENPPKPGIHPMPDAFIHAMPAYLPRKKIAGIKWVSGFSSNFKFDLPTIMGLLILNDVNTGQILSVMDCRWITAVRTAAVSAVAAKFLAKKNSEVIGIIGAGVQGRVNLLALRETLPNIKTVRIFDVNKDVLNQYISSVSRIVPFKIEECASSEHAMEGADVILTATGVLDKPIFEEKWVQKGALILPIHTRGWQKDIPHKVDKFIVDDWNQFSESQGSKGGFYGSLPKLYAELGEIVLGKKPGRENDSERIIDFNYGMAIYDIMMANEIYLRAKEKNLGTMLPLMQNDFQFS